MQKNHAFMLLFIPLAVLRLIAMTYVLYILSVLRGQCTYFDATIYTVLLLASAMNIVYLEKLLEAIREQFGLSLSGFYKKDYSTYRALPYVYIANLLNSTLISYLDEHPISVTFLKYGTIAMPVITIIIYIAVKTGSFSKFSQHHLH